MALVVSAPAAPAPFVWGPNGSALTPQQAAARQQIANAMITNMGTPQNVGEGLDAIGKALVAKSMLNQADEAYQAGQTKAATDFSSLGDDPSIGSLMSVASDPYLNQGQSAVASAMLDQKMRQSDPMYQAQLAGAQQTNQQNSALYPIQVQQAQEDLHKPIPVSSFDSGFIDPSDMSFTPATDPTMIDSMAASIEAGRGAPDYSGMTRQAATQLRAKLLGDGFDESGSQIDFAGAKHRAIANNGVGNVRLGATMDTASDSLGIIDNLAQQWNAGQYPVLNAANIKLAKNGAFGQAAASLATRLDSQIADVTSELGTIYKGGNSPTDHALELAATQLSSNWSSATVHDMIGLIRQNIAIRKAAMNSQGAIGQNGNANAYSPPAGPAAQMPPQSAATSATPPGAPKPGDVQDGYVYVGGDPANPASWKAQ